MKKILICLAIVVLITGLGIQTANASGLTQAQISAIVYLLQVFGADQSVINNVQVSLSGGTLTPTTYTSPTTSNYVFTNDLQLGSTGPDVSALQEFLINQGVLSGQATGNFYSLTLKAVKDFQTKQGITPVSGYVGPTTRGVINQILGMQTSNNDANAIVTKPVTDLSQQQNTFTLPNGAVVNSNGDVITPAQTIPQQNQTITQQNKTLSISIGTVTTNTTSVHIGWNTNIPTDSKVFLTLDNGSIQVISSVSGYSTQHFVDISNLKPNTQYSYTIEAINGTQDQKLTGVFSTSALPVPSVVNPTIVLDEQINLTTVAKSLASVTCPSTPVIVVRPANGMGYTQKQAPSLYGITASVSDNTIVWNLPNGVTNTTLEFTVASNCGQVSWSYYNSNYSNTPIATTNGWANLGMLHVSDITGGIGEAAFTDSTSTQTIIITAVESGGGTTKKTLTGQYNNGVLTI